jgi:hypothetical protein
MSESMQVLSAVGVGVALTSLFTGIGVWIGYRLGKAVAPPVNRALTLQLERLYRDLAICGKLGHFAEVQAQQIYSWATESSQIPSDMSATLQQLLATTTSLSHRLKETHSGGRKPSSKLVEPTGSQRSAPPAQLSDLSAKELGRFTMTEPRRAAVDGDVDRRRYAYDCLQRMLEWDNPNGPLPSVNDTVVVRCHDISMQGVSFFWPDDPNFKHLLISLGSGDDLVFMAAEIVHSKPVYMHGEWQHVVSCRFTKRMRAFTDQWKASAPAVAS